MNDAFPPTKIRKSNRFSMFAYLENLWEESLSDLVHDEIVDVVEAVDTQVWSLLLFLCVLGGLGKVPLMVSLLKGLIMPLIRWDCWVLEGTKEAMSNNHFQASQAKFYKKGAKMKIMCVAKPVHSAPDSLAWGVGCHCSTIRKAQYQALFCKIARILAVTFEERTKSQRKNILRVVWNT